MRSFPLLLFLTACTATSDGSPTEEMSDAHRQALADSARTWTSEVFAKAEALDHSVFDGFSSHPSARFALNGSFEDAEGYRSLFTQTFAGLDSQTIAAAPLDVIVLGPDAVLVSGEGDVEAFPKEGEPYGFHAAWTVVWHRDADGWRQIHGHQSTP